MFGVPRGEGREGGFICTKGNLNMSVLWLDLLVALLAS